MNPEFIYDTTLRDGEQMPGVVFFKDEKIKLAKKMSELGVGIIGLMPAVSKSEREVTEYLAGSGLQSQITAATMMKKEHIDIAKDCGAQRIILFTSVSDIHLNKKLGISRKKNMEKSIEFVDYANELGMTVDFAGEDSSRADISYLIPFINNLGDKIGYFLPCDTLGCLTPRQTYDFIKKIKSETDCKIGLHIHNDFGQATANTLAGIEAGADLFSGTFNGIGERAGNVPLEEVITALRYQYGREMPLKYEMLSEICSLVELYSKIRLQKHKPISGKNAFSHESGMHVDGMIKHEKNYENFNPERIGRKRRLLFGKHSGTNGLRYLFKDRFTENQYQDILQAIKAKSVLEKKAYSESEILTMYK